MRLESRSYEPCLPFLFCSPLCEMSSHYLLTYNLFKTSAPLKLRFFSLRLPAHLAFFSVPLLESLMGTRRRDQFGKHSKCPSDSPEIWWKVCSNKTQSRHHDRGSISYVIKGIWSLIQGFNLSSWRNSTAQLYTDSFDAVSSTVKP